VHTLGGKRALGMRLPTVRILPRILSFKPRGAHAFG